MSNHMDPKDNKKQNKEYLPLSDLMDKELPPIEWLINGIIPEGGVVVMAAKPSSLKTWTALQMAIDVASGKKFLGEFGTQQSPVLILDGESGERLLKNRMEVLNAPKDLPIYYQTFSRNEKFNKDFFDYTAAFCAVMKVRLVIFDSLIRFIDAKDENSSTDISNAFKWFTGLKDVGISVLLIHHSRKGNGAGEIDNLDSVRGSGDIIAACDVGIIIFGKNKNTITIKVGKNRYDEEIKPFRARFVKDSKNISHWEYIGPLEEKDNETEAIEAIVDILEKEGAINQKSLIEQVQNSGINIGQKKIVEYLDRLVIDKVIDRSKGARTERVYSLKGESQNG